MYEVIFFISINSAFSEQETLQESPVKKKKIAKIG